MNKGWIILGAIAGLVLLARKRASAAGPLFSTPSINDAIPTPAAQARYWALQAGGPPSDRGSNGTGIVTPATILIPGVSRVFGGTRAYAPPQPNQGSGAPPSPGGARLIPGPFPPGAAQPQSPVSPTSPWSPSRLMLAAPLAANSWMYNLSGLDPRVAFIAGSGGYVDIVPAEKLRETFA
jgi:hypothetical protein